MSEPSKEELLARIAQLELENEQLKQQNGKKSQHEQFNKIDDNFSLDEYKRYGRQMIVPQFGSLESQIKLKNSKVLVVGAGGLGSPALLYLSSAGIGKIGIIDPDTVDTSNLHRQVIHNTEMVGEFKCISAQNYINKLNPHVVVEVYPTALNNDNAFGIVLQYDLVLDCTDHPAVRYLINDVCVLLGKTIVSGSGLKSDGQLTVLNFANSGPAMAVETIKIITGYYTKDNFVPFLTSYSAYPRQQLRVFKMRKRQKDCAVCGENPQISQRMIEDGTINYKTFCGRATFDPIDDKFRVSPKDYDSVVQNKKKHILIDVRPREQFQITHLPNAINVQWDPTFRKADAIEQYLPDDSTKDDEIYVVCRFGNDSQLAAKKLIGMGYPNVRDIIGGLDKWSDDVDSKIPKY